VGYLQSRAVVICITLAGALLLAGGAALDVIQERHRLACLSGIAGVFLILAGVAINRMTLRNKTAVGRRT